MEGNPPFEVCLRRIKGAIAPATTVSIGYKFNNIASKTFAEFTLNIK